MNRIRSFILVSKLNISVGMFSSSHLSCSMMRILCSSFSSRLLPELLATKSSYACVKLSGGPLRGHVLLNLRRRGHTRVPAPSSAFHVANLVSSLVLSRNIWLYWSTSNVLDPHVSLPPFKKWVLNCRLNISGYL